MKPRTYNAKFRKVQRKVPQSQKKLALSYIHVYLVLHFANLVVYPAARQTPGQRKLVRAEVNFHKGSNAKWPTLP
jgi:hypothetical protein